MGRIVVGISGGVDSAVTAYLLKKSGYEVIGMTMQNWRQGEPGWEMRARELEDAKNVAAQLGIEHHVVDVADRFSEQVIRTFVTEYEHGRTPNPCVLCNPAVKWRAMLDLADRVGAEQVATGHYARVQQLDNGRYALTFADSASRNQTYALYRLSQEALARTVMPLGTMEKDQVRALAEEAGISIAQKADSMENCFIPDQDYAAYVESHGEAPVVPGHFVDPDGQILGEHRGLIHYTIGQRKGLGIAFGTPRYVIALRPETNEVVLGEDGDVFGTELVADQLCYIGEEFFAEGEEVVAQIRYSHRGERCILHPQMDGSVRCEFPTPVRAITPGQSVVFSRDGVLLGGGIII